MTVYLILALVLAAFCVSVSTSAFRRMWVFYLLVAKHVLTYCADRMYLRRLVARVTGRPYEPLHLPAIARRLCEDMGVTFVKFGQMVASSTGIFPESFVLEFQKVLDRVQPFSFSEVNTTLLSELGQDNVARLRDLSVAPLASASIAQVHTAELSDGTKVVVKVQRPNLRRIIEVDTKIMRFAARILQRFVRDAQIVNLVGVIEDLKETLDKETDFRREARNLDRFNEIMAEEGQLTVHAPVPHWEFVTERVLVMERFIGYRIDDVESLKSDEVDAEELLVTGMRAWFQCLVLHGFFHGDMHAGNLMVLQQKDREHHVGFLDFGIVGQFTDSQRILVTDYMIAFATKDFRKVAQVIASMGGVSHKVDMEAFATDLDRVCRPLMGLSFGKVNYAEVIPAMSEIARRHNMTMPRAFVLITKQFVYFDRYAKLLAPQLNVFTDPRLVTSMMSDIAKARQKRNEANA